MQNKLIWPAVAIICAIIIASGIYLGLRDSQPQPTLQTFTETSLSEYDIPGGRVSTKSDRSDPIVYVTRTGQRYHTGSCSYLKYSKIPMKLSEARKRYRPCSRCRPSR